MKDEFEEKLRSLLKKNDETLWENNYVLDFLTKFLRFRVKIKIAWIKLKNFVEFILKG